MFRFGRFQIAPLNNKWIKFLIWPLVAAYSGQNAPPNGREQCEFFASILAPRNISSLYPAAPVNASVRYFRIVVRTLIIRIIFVSPENFSRFTERRKINRPCCSHELFISDRNDMTVPNLSRRKYLRRRVLRNESGEDGFVLSPPCTWSSKLARISTYFFSSNRIRSYKSGQIICTRTTYLRNSVNLYNYTRKTHTTRSRRGKSRRNNLLKNYRNGKSNREITQSVQYFSAQNLSRQ